MIPDGAIEAAKVAAEAAREAIRPYFRAGLGADDKADASPVTAADRAAETAMRTALARHTPGFGVIGEEFGDDRRGRFNWVIDPIDGTREFITGRASFVTLIGLVEDGVPVLGLIDQPMTGERWLAADGRVAFTGPFGGVPGCRRRAALGEAELSCTGPEWFAPAQHAAFDRLGRACRRVSWGDNAYAAGLL
ncbi:MAG: histidinol phosphate phosphatase, partial [Acidiphilium sp. 21-66-27]